MRNINELLNAGTMAQIEKLKENEHKDGFDSLDIIDTYMRLFDEVLELGEELFDNFGMADIMKLKEKPDYVSVRRESADVANFAHMIVLNCVKKSDAAKNLDFEIRG